MLPIIKIKMTGFILIMLMVVCGFVQAADIAAYWPLDGHAGDMSGHGYNGTLMGGAWTQGKDGAGLRLTGLNQYIKVDDPNGLNNLSFSVAFWCKIDSWNESWNTAISFGGEDRGWACKRESTNSNWRFIHRGDPEGDWGTNGPSVDNGYWTHFVVSWDNPTKTFRWYKNGMQASERTIAGHVMKYNLADSINIGACSQGGAHQFLPGGNGDCLMDEVYIFNGAIDAATVLNLYHNGLIGDTIPASPSPADGAMDVSEGDVELSWTPGIFGDPNLVGAVVEHHLYIGTDRDAVQHAEPDNPMDVYQGVVTLPVTRSGILKDQTYYWRIDETQPADSQRIRGIVWSFESEKSVPIISRQPQKTRADLGGTAVFQIQAASVSSMSYQWRKNGADLNDELDHITGSQTDTLTISHVGEADESDYSCVITNSSGPVTSNTVRLIIKRLLGYWPLDTVVGDPNVTPDVSGHGHDALLVNSPARIEGPGSNNHALQFNTTLRTRLDVPNEAFFDVYDALSVSTWVKTTWDGGDWRGVITKSGETGGWSLRRYWNTGQANFTFRGTSAGDELASGININDDKWHLVTGTYDGVTRKVYVDGELAASVLDDGIIQANDAPVLIGCAVWMDGSVINHYESWFTGGIDDVRIYNYALTPGDIAKLYVDVMGGSKCIAPPLTDFNGDCVVDMLDFVGLASQFMECNLVPDCLN
ncbi:MAG: LamG-like jellyroll fold domain-containing protein [Anaerohalosphaeraceae bacterium]